MSSDIKAYWNATASRMPKASQPKDAVREGWMSYEDFKASGMECVDLANPTNKHGGIPMDSRDPHKMWVDVSDKHNLILSSSGTGKSRRIIAQYILSLQNTDESAVVFDPKGELTSMTAATMQASGKKIYILNAREPRKSSGWNMFEIPFELYNSGDDDLADDAISLIMDIMNTLYPLIPDAKEPYWDLCGRSLLSGIAWEALKNANSIEDINLAEISRLLNEHFADDDTIYDFARHLDKDGLQYSLLAPAIINAESTRRCIISESRSRITPFVQSEALSDMLSRNDIHFSDIVSQPSIVYLVTPDETDSLNAVVGVFIKLFYKFLIRMAYKNNGSLDNTFHFIIDETANVGRIEDLPSMLSACRSRNIRITTVFQSLGQIEMLYASGAETIKGNCGNWIYIFTRDRMTLQEISFLLGKKSDDTPQMTTSELQTLDATKGEAIILKARKAPFMGQLSDISMFGISLDLPVPKIEITTVKKKEVKKEEDDLFDFENFEYNYAIVEALETVVSSSVNWMHEYRLVKEIREMLFDYKIRTLESKKICDILEAIMIYHDEFLIQKLKASGFNISKRSQRKFCKRCDDLRERIKKMI